MKNKPIKHLAEKLRIAKAIFWILFFAVIIYFTYQNIVRATVSIWLIQALPFIAFVPGILKNYYRSYSWLCFVLLLYFVIAVEGVFSSNADLLSWLYLALIVSLFIVSMMCGRWQQRATLLSQTLDS